MKTSFLVTFLLAAAVCTHGLEEVKDSNGNPVRVGAQYFIQPVKTESNNGGGLVPAATNILPFCPLGITQTLLPYQPGLPVSFGYHPNILGRDTIDTSADINIEFRSPIWPVCTEFSKLWAVDSSSASNEPAVIIGGEPKSPNSAFKIEKAAGAHTYKLTTSSGTVGTTPGAWLSAPQLLVTNDVAKTLFVKFVKVDNDATTATTSTSRVEKLGLRMFPFY
ncbi:Kunitz family trypsin and protease inhibitor protein [Raphanus sativus]|uniref:Kunitz trypsin inhibitor 2 n=1 Tax=Raphanus sativus TaxID=3726 RepID=A0A6J0KZN0_RAPSA|nr:kunitz trypsin inhibitor 2 [Raphanus sativus]KAJ4874927.1 Kunitz family trypsin and protease inhibitor protein [Raphanus sativus]